MRSSLEKQLSKIEKLAEEKQNEMDAQNYKKYSPLLDIAMKHLGKQQVLLYGGLAIDLLMPKNLKIYKKNTLPDIDVFCTNPKKIAKGLIAEYKKHGYTLGSFAEALHEGTYKVFIEGVQVADLTGISKYAFGKLQKNAIRVNGIRVVDPEFLRLSLHTLLSQSNDAFRWPKVFERLIKFYEVYPPRICRPPKTSVTDKLPNALITDLYDVLENKPYVHFGVREIQMMLEHRTPFANRMPVLQMLVDHMNLEDVVKSIIQHSKIQKYHLTSSIIFVGDDFAPPHCIVFYKNLPIIALYATDACLTYNQFDKHRVASIHTMLRMYLSICLSSYRHLQKYSNDFMCIGNMLSMKQQKIEDSKKKVHRQLILECYGVQPGLVTLRRNMVARRKNLLTTSSERSVTDER